MKHQRKQQGLLKSLSVVSCMTLLSRISGLWRDMAYSYFFGATAGIDAYIVASKIPNFLRRIFAEGSFSLSFVPVLTEYQEKKSQDELMAFISHLAGLLGFVLCVISAMAMIAAPWVVSVFAPGFAKDVVRFAWAADMLRITFPYILFIALTAFAGSILNAFHRFAVSSITPVIFNVTQIVVSVYLAPHLKHPVYALAWGMSIAGVLQLLLQIPFLWRLGLLPMPRIDWKDVGVRKVLKLMVPTLLGSSVSQVNLLLDTLFASFLPIGSLSWLYYSDRLMQFPLGVFGIAISTVVLPHLSQRHVNSANGDFSSGLDWGLRLVLLIGVPASLAMGLLVIPLLSTLFQYGKFTSADVLKTSYSLLMFALGLTAFMLVKILAAGFYSRQDSKTPVKIGIFSMVLNSILGVSLMFSMHHAGLALATSISAWVNGIALLYVLLRKKAYQPQVGWRKYAGQLIAANIGLMTVLLWFRQTPQTWFLWHWPQRVLHLSGLMFAGISIYFLILVLTGVRLHHFRGN